MADGDGNGRLSFGEAATAARQFVEELAGRSPESISGATRAEGGGWTVCVDVVELSRIPPSTDLLATYEVTLDAGGDLVELARARRYVRNQSDEE